MIPPRWSLDLAWAIHKALYALSGHRLGAGAPADGRLGTLFLRTRGRVSGTIRRNGLSYVDDGPNLAVVASNAGADTDPAWWRNLQATPGAVVELGRAERAVVARLATPEERVRIWARFTAAQPSYLEYERAAARPIPVIVLEPA